MKNKKFLTIALLLFVGAVAAFGDANQDLMDINKGVQDNVQLGVGGWAKMAIGWAPLILFFAMALGTLIYQVKKSGQSQDNDYLKIGIWTFAMAFLGGILGVALDSLFGAAVLGKAACGVEVFNVYWKEALGIIQKGTAQYSCQ